MPNFKVSMMGCLRIKEASLIVTHGQAAASNN
jgi:hypothetical protein